LAEALKDEGCDSIYLDRLRTSFDPQSHVEKLEEELVEEMARALANTAAKVNYNFAKLDLCAKKMNQARNDHERLLSAREFNTQRDLCFKARQDLLIHRQALGFKTQNHRAVEAMYPLPPKVSMMHEEEEDDDEQKA